MGGIRQPVSRPQAKRKTPFTVGGSQAKLNEREGNRKKTKRTTVFPSNGENLKGGDPTWTNRPGGNGLEIAKKGFQTRYRKERVKLQKEGGPECRKAGKKHHRPTQKRRRKKFLSCHQTQKQRTNKERI